MTGLEASDGLTRDAAERESRESLTGARIDYAVVGLVVISLFLERLDRSLYLRGTSAIPDPAFDAAVLLLSLRYLQELARHRVRLGRPTRREYVVAGFVVFVFVLGVVSLVSLPSWMSSGSQVLKSTIHLGFLAYTAFLIGRAVSRELFEFALKLYFGLASAAGALAIVQAVDLNAGSGFLTRHLHLVYRLHSNGYKAPCSIFSEPAQLGYISVAALVVAVLRWKSIGARWAIAGGTLCTLALFLSFPAGPAIVAVVLGLILAFERRPKLSRRSWAGIGALVAVLAAVALASSIGSALYQRASGVVTGSDPSAKYRRAVDNASLHIWRIAPVTGIGIGNSRNLLPFVYHSPTSSTPLEFTDSSAYIGLLGETGVLGLAASLFVLASFVWPATRPVRFATVTQLNTIGVAVSFFVAGSFLLPTLWFWGGLRLAAIRDSGQPDLFEAWVTRERRLRHRRALRLLFAALVVASVAALAYGFRVQSSNGSSVRAVNQDGISELTTAPRPGDAGLAVVYQAMWGQHLCGPRCRESLRYIGGRIWEIRARWPNGKACLVLDLASFRTTKRGSPGLTNGFIGLTACPLGAE